MKAINSCTSSGSEAIAIAILSWWLSTNPVKEQTIDWLKGQAPDIFLDRTDHWIGAVVLQNAKFVQDFCLQALSCRLA